MVEIGRVNTLEVVRETDNGLYLDGRELGEILMPKIHYRGGEKFGMGRCFCLHRL
jgi:predicted RNA-binding protein (virulence factor B family)